MAWLRNNLYRRLLALYPGEFRAEYGADMELDFQARQQREPFVRLLIEVAIDIVRTAPQEHYAMLIQDLRYTLRQLAAQPGFTLIAILSLALGIGANTAIFSLADALILRPAPVPGTVYRVQGNLRGDAFPENVSHLDYLDIRDKAKSLDGVLALAGTSLVYHARTGEPPQLLYGQYVSGNFLRVAQVEPVMGRDFRPDEDTAPGRDPVTLLSHDAWVNLFGRAPDVVGRKVRLNNYELTIIGVTPEKFPGVLKFVRPSFYIPLAMNKVLEASRRQGFLNRRDAHDLELFARLQSGVPVETAKAEIATLGRQLATAYPATHARRSLELRTEFERRIQESPPDAALMTMLMTIVALVLLIACANVANLLLARAQGRAREIAVRLAIGAHRGRLFRQLMTESFVLATAGGLIGLAIAYGATRIFATIPVEADVPVVLDFRLDTRVLLFSLCASAASALFFGLAPAWRALQPDLVTALKSGEAQSRRQRFLGRYTLVAAQLALSCVLLVAVAMVANGFRANLMGEPGFRLDHLLIASVSPDRIGYNQADSQRILQRALDRARELPGVQHAALASALPTANQGISFMSVVPEGYQMPRGQESVAVFHTTVSDAYFDTLNIPILQGRPIQRTDTAETPPVAVVNEVFARLYWPGQNPIGKRVSDAKRSYQVVGVARRSKYLWITEPPTAAIYTAAAQSDRTGMKLILHTQAEPGALAAPVRQMMLDLAPQLPVAMRTMEDYHDKRTTFVYRLLAGIIAALGVCGLILALVGLYGVMAFTVGRRTREIGIRMAIGADERGVLRLVLRQGARIALVGVIIGLMLAAVASRALESGLLGIAVAHPMVYAVVPVLMMIVALAACYVPALRASRVDPMRALRTE